MEAWELEAREAIRDLVARYNAEGDAGRLDALVALFADDAVLEFEGRSYAGAEAIRGMFHAAAAATQAAEARFIHHHTATLVIDLEGPARARGACYFQTLTERGLDHWGRYRDLYGAESGRWRFVRRRVELDGWVPGGWADRTRARLPPS